MSHTWSKSALALHELGLAASFGGLLGAALATTSVLNFNAGRSSRWSAIASALP